MVKKTLKGLWLVVIGLLSLIILAGTSFFLLKFKYIPENMIMSVKVEQTDEKKKETLVAGQKLSDEIQGEGIVLVQNKNEQLPLSKDTKQVNVFGWASSQWLAGGSGSGTVKGLDVDIVKALEDAGVSTNSDLTKMYEGFFGERPFETLFSYDYEGYRLYEPAITDKNYYSEALLKEAKEYSDTALMVVGRFAGESSDAPKEQYKLTEKDGAMVTDEARSYLDLSVEEEELLHYLGENYDNVVLLVNSINTMALGEVETIPGVDAVLLVGATGTASAVAVPDVLFGKVSPSGRTTDTYAYDFATNASYANSGLNGIGAYTGAEGLYPMDGKTINGNVSNKKQLYEQVSYLDYAEGIFIGYRWYETADVEGYWQKIDNDYGKGYDGVVQYPFGYGLSYTDFKWEVLEVSPKPESNLKSDDTIKVAVKVTNTGKVAGKEVVQLYYTPPYTKGGIEKSATNLAAFEKTDLLEPGASDTLVLEFNVRDMASYDSHDKNKNDFVGYELDKGLYEVNVMTNAHDLAKSEQATISYKIAENIDYPTDNVTGAEIKNQFTGENTVDGVSVDGTDSQAGIEYLTRENFEKTFPQENIKTRELTENIKALNLFKTKAAKASKGEQKEQAKNKKEVLLATNGVVSDLGLALGENYDDQRWDQVINELTTEEMKNLVLHGYTHTEEVASVGKPLKLDLDGPSQIGSFSFGGEGTGFPNATVIAQTWNKELAYNFGLTVGKQSGNLGVSGWYAPGVNIHRSPFGGRNYEYYSEDTLLSGVMAAQTITGAKDTGVYTYLKHLVLYEQESNRDSIYTWATEQSLREIYLKPFQYAIQEGGATGLMSAYGRLGAVWAGGSEALLTNVLRNEWGFKGSVITDYSDHHAFMNMDQALRAGGDLWMDGMLRGDFKGETESEEFNVALKKASKNILYTWLNAEYSNKVYNETAEVPFVKPIVTSKFPYWLVIIGVLDVVIIGSWGFWLTKQFKKRKANN